jgi:hypothetical protein
MGFVGTILFYVIAFILIWIFEAVAIHVTAALIGKKKPFSKALLMALLLAIIFAIVYAVLPGYWWLTIIVYFIIMMLAYIETYDMSTGQSFVAAIIVIIVAVILILIIVFLVVAIIALI